MAKKKSILDLQSNFNLQNTKSYNRFLFSVGATVPNTPASLGNGTAGTLTAGVAPGANNPPQSSNNTPPILPPPNAAAIYNLITNLEDFLITEAGDNITTQLQ
jgi:hypothetical protein